MANGDAWTAGGDSKTVTYFSIHTFQLLGVNRFQMSTGCEGLPEWTPLFRCIPFRTSA